MENSGRRKFLKVVGGTTAFGISGVGSPKVVSTATAGAVWHDLSEDEYETSRKITREDINNHTSDEGTAYQGQGVTFEGFNEDDTEFDLVTSPCYHTERNGHEKNDISSHRIHITGPNDEVGLFSSTNPSYLQFAPPTEQTSAAAQYLEAGVSVAIGAINTFAGIAYEAGKAKERIDKANADNEGDIRFEYYTGMKSGDTDLPETNSCLFQARLKDVDRTTITIKETIGWKVRNTMYEFGSELEVRLYDTGEAYVTRDRDFIENGF